MTKTLEVSRVGSPLTDSELAQVLSSSRGLDQLRVRRVTAASPDDLASLKSSYHTVTGTNAADNDPKIISQDLKDFLNNAYAKLNTPTTSLSAFPFAEAYSQQLSVLSGSLDKGGWEWYARDFSVLAADTKAAIDELTTAKGFMDGTSKTSQIWQEIKDFLREKEANLAIVDADGSSAATLAEITNDPQCYTSGRFPEARQIVKQLSALIEVELTSRREQEIELLKAFEDSLKQQYDYPSQPEKLRLQFDEIFAQATARLETLSHINVIKNYANTFKEQNYNRIARLFKRDDDPQEPGDKPRLTVSSKDIPVSGYAKAIIENESDVDSYLDLYKQALNKALGEGKTILP